MKDVDSRESLDKTDDIFAIQIREKTPCFFSSFAKLKNIDFVKESCGVHYVLYSHFNRDKNEDMVSQNK